MPRSRVPATRLTPQAVRKAVNDHFGVGTLMTADDPSLEIERVPCGVMEVDYIMNGGFARGRHIEAYGGFSVGKTALSLKTIGSSQADGGRCAFVDAENTFDPKWAAHLGVKLPKLELIQQREHGQRLIDVMEALLYSRLYDVIVLDSIAALLPKAEKESQMDAADMGTQQARLMSKALRKLTTANQNTVLFYINQQRESIGSMFGPRMVTSGGRAMSFYAGTRLELTRTEDIKATAKTIDHKTGKDLTTQVVVGHRVLIRVAKDKTGAQPHDQTTCVFNYKLSDFDPLEGLIYLGRRMGYVHCTGVDKKARWWMTGQEASKQAGRNRFKAWLTRNPQYQDALYDLIVNTEGDT